MFEIIFLLINNKKQMLNYKVLNDEIIKKSN